MSSYGRAHKKVLDSLGVLQVQYVIGGSMGGMQVLEWAFFGKDYVQNIVPIATSAKLSAWCISWNEAQRQSIYSDPNYGINFLSSANGYYSCLNPPAKGLAAARMAALMTYRTRDSFEERFGRKKMLFANSSSPKVSSVMVKNAVLHNEGNNYSSSSSEPVEVFSAQSYLRYQGDKFVNRFDANCYIALTRKLDAHDVSAGRGTMEEALRMIKQPTLVIGEQIYCREQRELADLIPNSELVIINSFEGHDGFLLEFKEMNRHLTQFMKKCTPQLVSDTFDENEDYSKVPKSLCGESEGADALLW